MRTITKSILFALLVLCGNGVACAQAGLQSSNKKGDNALSDKRLQMYIGTGQGAVPDAAFNVYYENGFKARLRSLGDHFSLFSTLSTGIAYSSFYDYGSEGVVLSREDNLRENIWLLSVVGGVEYHTPLGKKCAFFGDLGFGPATLRILSDNWIDLSLHAGVGVVFRNGLSAGLQLRYLPTYVCTNRNYSFATPFYRQLLMWGVQVGWYIF